MLQENVLFAIGAAGSIFILPERLPVQLYLFARQFRLRRQHPIICVPPPISAVSPWRGNCVGTGKMKSRTRNQWLASLSRYLGPRDCVPLPLREWSVAAIISTCETGACQWTANESGECDQQLKILCPFNFRRRAGASC